jgi:thioesterase domain-containing protein/NAD(P)-dependent dehydrogenase (short-subunit alcohol dehydrogenase family)
LFVDDAGLGARIAQDLGGSTVTVSMGERFAKLSDDRYTVRPGSRSDYEALVEALTLHDRLPSRVVHLWNVTKPRGWQRLRARMHRGERDWREAEDRYFHDLMALAQALGSLERPLTLDVVSSELFQLGNERGIEPAKALLLGPVRVIPREFPQIRTRSIDVSIPSAPAELDRLVDQLTRELRAPVADRVVALRGVTRWVQRFDEIPLAPAERRPRLVRAGAVVLITGGMGGIGLEIAEHLARTAAAKLVLVGRTALPERARWTEYLADHSESDPLRRRIAKLLAIEAAGGEVLALAADVTDTEQMLAVSSAVRRRFGVLHGIIHAAGTIDDGLISFKSRESAEAVIRVKARGALVLDEVFGKGPLDFFVLFSSVSSALGLQGQADYTAANAFLEAFAAAKSATSKTAAIAIGWNAWQKVGMAVALAEQTRPAGRADRGRPGAHPCLERVAVDSDDEWLFVTPFSRARHWLVGEHVALGGQALIPGTGYLELARAALAHEPESAAGGRTVELRGVTFLSPFVVAAGQARELKLRLSRRGPEAGAFCFFSDSETEPHVTGRIGRAERPLPARVDLEAIAASCRERETVVGGQLPQSFMQFGPRWANVERISYGRDQALIYLKLPDRFSSDGQDYRLHPALLDMATGGAQALAPDFDPNRDFYVPLSYGRVTVYRSLPARVVSHVRLRPNATRGLSSFDISLYDTSGTPLVEIEDFTMKRLSEAANFASDTERGPDSTQAPGNPAAGRLASVVREGILPAEGVDAFDRILASGLTGSVSCSSIDLNDWLAELDASTTPEPAEGAPARDTEGFARPNLSTSFVSPRSEVERELAAMWRDLLGVTDVGVYDDFFELGGQSLVAVRLFNRIRKRYSVDLPLSTLFEAPSIAACARVLADEAGLPESATRFDDSELTTVSSPVPEEASSGAPGTAPADSDEAPASRPRPTRQKARWSCLVPMQNKGSRRPFYCIAGMGGTLNNLRKLALLTSDTRPIYGLQPPGADDRSQLLYSVEDLARRYISEIRSVQPQGPYLLGGYSGGGVAAFEISRQLLAEGQSVAFLAFIDSFSPALPQRSFGDRARIHWQRVADQGPRYLFDTVGRRLVYERWDIWRRVASQLGKAFPRRYRYESIQDSWMVAEERYRPTPTDGRATLFRAREESALSLWTAVEVDEFHGWQRYLEGGVTVELCPGNHSTMCEEPNVRVLAQKLRLAIDTADPDVTLGDAGDDRARTA